jgi:hypothetical protein
MDKLITKVAILKVIEEENEQDAIDIVSNPNLNGSELSELLQAHVDKNIIDTETGEPIQFSKKVFSAGIKNRFFQLSNENKK